MSEQKNSAVNFSGQQSVNRLLLESVLNHALDAIVVTNSANEIIAWNPVAEKLFGYTSREAIGQSIELIIDRDTVLKIHTLSANSDSIPCRLKDGTVVHIAARFNEVTDSDKNLLTFCYFFEDYLEKAKQQEAIKEKERAMESFMYSVSHDLRAPLRRIINYAEILQEDHASSMGEEVQRLVSRMTKNAEKMGELINDLLSYSHVSQQPIKKSLINVADLVTHAISEIKTSPEKERFAFTIKTLAPVHAELSMVKRVFENLFSNAIKFSASKESPVIEVGSETTQDSIRYYVKDNGIGFDPQYTYKLFNIFQRLHNPNEYEGTGIGLAIVRQIVSRHGGKVWAEGKVDEGATFWFSLPR